MARTCSKVRTARAARVFSLARPIKFLICGFVLAVPMIRAKAPYRPQGEYTPSLLFTFFSGRTKKL